MDELIVFLILKTGWSLEYTTNLVNKLPIPKLNALLAEIFYQEDLQQYRTACNFAMIVITLVSSKRRRYKISDVVGKKPRRKNEVEDINKAAEKAGIILPTGEKK
ncbi:MAG: hypothetical protein PHV11_08935 [Candidatus Bipolaricaulis sp.]|nr:hypothetical protein [Candidatus Bipolaricaulis sp.]